ncbi:MAG: alpha/beta hydrolase [Candidatus Sulfotelmatobacter sp.]
MSATTNPPVPARQWIRIIVRSGVVLVALALFAGFLYENISEARDRRFHPMPGQLIDVGGYKMHIDCTGQGSPTVILDSGLGDSYVSWVKVQPQIAKFTRVCSYDRAGLGYSDSSSRPRTSRVMATELHTLLHNAGVSPPYVLVGHSMGGYNVRLFYSFYRTEVAGIVLIDSSHPEQEKRFPQELHDLDKTWVREQEFLTFSMPFGVPRLLGFCGNDAAVRAADCNFHSYREGLTLLRTFSESAAQAATTGSLGDLPLAVISHDPDVPQPEIPADIVKPMNEAWEQMQDELAHLSTRGVRTVAKNSSHYIQLDRPDVVIETVRGVVEQARQLQFRPDSNP